VLAAAVTGERLWGSMWWWVALLQVTTPVAIMTSDAKGNHRRICKLLEDSCWFGRSNWYSFKLFRWVNQLYCCMLDYCVLGW